MNRNLSLVLFAIVFLGLLFCSSFVKAHSGKAAYHVIIDTDGAADDLRALCYLLSNHKAEVLAITSVAGALPAHETACRVQMLLSEFHHQGIPVGIGRENHRLQPSWRAHSRQICWADSVSGGQKYQTAVSLLEQSILEEEEPVVVVALGALTNLADLLEHNAEAAHRINRIIWWGSVGRKPHDINYADDPKAADKIIKSGIKLEVIHQGRNAVFPITKDLLCQMAALPSPYAQKVVQTHRASPLKELIDAAHLKAWDDLVVLYLFAPYLFDQTAFRETVSLHGLSDVHENDLSSELLAILRGNPDSESRVFYGFPIAKDLYAADVIPIIDEALARHGEREWRSVVLTNELHGHLGIYATIGVKMGIRARAYFNIGVDDIQVKSFAGDRPPISCLNDGLQVGAGATLGHGLIQVQDNVRARPEAIFSFKGRSILLKLKSEWAERIRKDILRGIQLYGKCTEPYWNFVRGLALRYWVEFDRNEIFDEEYFEQ